MKKAKVLFVLQEITPYLPETQLSIIGRNLPQGIQEKGREIRTFMPKYGSINERRNQLHEVIRLSGMNLIINENDHPLIIKVASIQSARMQIYFIDNEDYFGRKFIVKGDNNLEFADNDERSIFFTRGVIETIIKLNWSPDVIHCHGWFTALTALWVKKVFKDNPLFADAKVVYSLYNDDFKKSLNKNFKTKIQLEGVTKKDIDIVTDPSYLNLNKMVIDLCDGIILGGDTINPELDAYIKKSKKPYLDYIADDSYIDMYSEFYDKILK